MSKQIGTLLQDGIKVCSVSVLSHTPAQRPVIFGTAIGGDQFVHPQRVIPGSITFTSTESLDPTKHSYSFVQGGSPATKLDIARIETPKNGLYTIHANLGFPGE